MASETTTIVLRVVRGGARRLADRINAIWPSDSGESRWRVSDVPDGARTFSPARYARFVRRAGQRAPLVETEIPRLRDEVAAEVRAELHRVLPRAVRERLAPHLQTLRIEVL